MKSVSRLLALAGLLAGVPALAGVNSWTQTGPEGGPPGSGSSGGGGRVDWLALLLLGALALSRGLIRTGKTR